MSPQRERADAMYSAQVFFSVLEQAAAPLIFYHAFHTPKLNFYDAFLEPDMI